MYKLLILLLLTVSYCHLLLFFYFMDLYINYNVSLFEYLRDLINTSLDELILIDSEERDLFLNEIISKCSDKLKLSNV
jgi:hypothetical protein